jgi:hypothetical protein
MVATTPQGADLLTAGEGPTIPWDEALTRLTEAHSYWLVTIHPGGPPHVRPVLAVVVGATAHGVMNLASRKAGNLAHEPRCSLTARTEDLDLVIEGIAHPISDAAALQEVPRPTTASTTGRSTLGMRRSTAPTEHPPPDRLLSGVPHHPSTRLRLRHHETFGPRSTRWRF